jgi:hypothetical protein
LLAAVSTLWKTFEKERRLSCKARTELKGPWENNHYWFNELVRCIQYIGTESQSADERTAQAVHQDAWIGSNDGVHHGHFSTEHGTGNHLSVIMSNAR